MAKYFLFYSDLSRNGSHPPNRPLNSVMRQVEKTIRREKIREKVAQNKRRK